MIDSTIELHGLAVSSSVPNVAGLILKFVTGFLSQFIFFVEFTMEFYSIILDVSSFLYYVWLYFIIHANTVVYEYDNNALLFCIYHGTMEFPYVTITILWYNHSTLL